LWKNCGVDYVRRIRTERGTSGHMGVGGGVGHDTEIKVVKWVLVNKTKITIKRKIFGKS
jgi:hypothetical protein